ncbi:hypothetical protein [Legionella brunensis]|uniref:Uncharacterized protein n=1 Tax=Legionella brunensis TaxID=29422 RepID=A0A0W0SSR1_9GAMM|nr:hypothetical protein [Legionella brunensis]KTC86366.1 hypothetical protein Lbru_0860 [Legionella brunensis]
MLKYNSEEALLVAWKKKLEAITTNRTQLKKELLDLLESTSKTSAPFRLSQFNRMRTQLLNDEHNQGWSWTSNFSWLWRILSFLTFFQLFKTNPQPGSRLRQALEELPPINTELVTIASPLEIISLDDAQFEEALFYEPQKAFNDLQIRMQNLKNTSKTEILISIERLEAIKFRLSPQDYCHFLSNLFEIAPKECLNYHYQLYREDNYEVFNSHEFIEHHLMARTLMRLFVSGKKIIPEDIELNPYLYAAQQLILILSFTSAENDPLQTLISRSSSGSIDLETVYTDVSDQILEILKTKIEQSRFESRSYSTPLKVAEDLFENTKLKTHPLLIQVTRLACELFLLTYHSATSDSKTKEWQPSTLAYQTLKLFSEKILGSWRSPFNLNNLEQSSLLLDPYQFHSDVHPDYQAAELSIMAILIHTTLSGEDGLRQARKINSISTKEFNAQQLDWILDRVASVYPNPNLVLKLENIFKRTIFFNLSHLSSWNKSSLAMQPEEIIINITQHLQAAREANSDLNVEAENAFHDQALNAFHYLLNHCTLNAKQLNLAYKFLQQFEHHCIKQELFLHWNQQIKTLLSNLMCWTAENTNLTETQLEEFKKDENIAAIVKNKEPLIVIQKLCFAAASFQNGVYADFSYLQNCSQMAVHYFAVLMDEYTMNPPEKHKITEARELLMDHLKPYLTEAQYFSWNKKLSESQINILPKSNVGFFEATTVHHKNQESEATTPEVPQQAKDNSPNIP